MYTWLDDYNAIRAKHPEMLPTKEQIEAARAEHQTDEVNIDDNAMLRIRYYGTGYWVSAWVCVTTDEEFPHEP